MEQGDTKVTAEVSGQQEVASEEASGQQTSTEVATEEVSGQQEVASEEASGQQTSTEVATEEVSGQETCNETRKLVDSGDVMTMQGKDGNNIASYSSEGCGNNTVSTSNEGCGNDIVSTSNEDCKGEGDPPSDFFDDFFQEEFLEGLDIVDSWIDEENDDGNENETEKSNKESRSQSDRNLDERRDRGRDDRKNRSLTDTRKTFHDRRGRVSDNRRDRMEEDSRNSRRGSQTEVGSLDRKDDSRYRRGRSSDRRDASRNHRARSPRRERSLENSDSKRTRGERVQERREDNRVHREGSLERKDDNRARRENSIERRMESRRRRMARFRLEKRDRSHRERSLEKEDDNRRSTRVIHREKSLERKPVKERSYDRGNKDRSSEKISGSVREGERDAYEEERRKESNRGERIDQAKKLDDRQGRKDDDHMFSTETADSIGGNKETPVESNSAQQVTAEKLKMEVSVVSYPHPNLYKKLREENKSEENNGQEFKQLPHIAPNEPVPPGTEDEYVLSETNPKDKSDITTENDKVIAGVTKEEKTEAVESKVSSSDQTKDEKAKNIDKSVVRSVSPKRKKRSRSTSAERARRLRDEKQMKINEYFNLRIRQQRAARELNKSRERTSPGNEKSRGRSRDKPSRWSGPSRERSRERLGKRERSIDRHLPERSKERFGNREKPFEGDVKLHSTSAEEQKVTPRPLSPAMYERFSSPSLSLELSPVSSARERSLSRSPSRERYKRARRHRSRRHSLSPISLSDTSLSLSSESEYERKKRTYNNRSRQRKPPFLKELAEILAADSVKRSSYPTPPPGYADGPQNTPHLEMVPSDVIYPPGPVEHLMPGYPQPMFQPGMVPAEEYPPEAYAQHLPPDAMQPYMPHMHPPPEGPPPTDFVFSLPPPHSNVPLGAPMPGPVPVGDPNMFQFQGGHMHPEMNPPNIHPGHPYPPEAYHVGDPYAVPQNPHMVANAQDPSLAPAPPPPMISDTMPYSAKKMSLSSVLEASVKVPKQHIGNEREAVIQRCEKAIRILKADEHLVTGGCFTFVPVASQNIGLDNQASGPHAYLSPLLSGKNLTFNFTKPPEPKKQPATVKKTVLNAVRSLLAERSLPVPEPQPKPCERCLENSKKTFVDSSVQTNEVVLCSVATQSEYQSSSESDFHRLDVQSRVQSEMYHGPNRSRVGSEFENQQYSRMMMREDLPLDIQHGRPSDYGQSMNFPSNLPYRDFARNDMLPESRSVNMSPPRREPMSFDPRSSDFHDSPNLSRPVRSSSGPFSGMPLKGILKSSRPSAPEMFPPRPEQDIPAQKSKDVWSRLGPLSSSGPPYGGDPESLALSGGLNNPDLSNRFSSIPSGMTREEYQRYFMGLSNQQRIDKFGSLFNSSGPYSQNR